MLDVQGLTLTPQEREVIAHPQVGGLILFGRNYDNVQQLTELNREIRECKKNILIAVDHEGGRVQRFREGFTRIPSMYTLAKQAPHLLTATAQLIAQELIATGIDFTFAPVLDRFNPASQVIGDRALSESPQEVAHYANQFIDGLILEGMAAIGKHFPGHGGVESDTHITSAKDPRALTEIMQSDLIPFKQLAPKLRGVMPAHVVFPCISEQPVGFCAQWLQTILRGQLGFKGAIFSDDLSMAAAKVAGNPLERGLAAIEAGCSMALLCNNPNDAIQLIEGLEAKRVTADESLLLPLSAYKRRVQQGFNWHNLINTHFWQKTHASLNDLNEKA